MDHRDDFATRWGIAARYILEKIQEEDAAKPVVKTELNFNPVRKALNDSLSGMATGNWGNLGKNLIEAVAQLMYITEQLAKPEKNES